jgi:transcriptional regulator with XRE-family HTH domain
MNEKPPTTTGWTIGQELRRLREKSGESLRGLSATIGVSHSYISDIENGRRQPSTNTLQLLTSALSNQGAAFEELAEMKTGLDHDTKLWVSQTPGVRELLVMIRDEGIPVTDMLAAGEEIARARRRKKGKRS